MKNKYILPALLAAVGLFLIYKQVKGKSKPLPVEGGGEAPSGGGVAGVGTSTRTSTSSTTATSGSGGILASKIVTPNQGKYMVTTSSTSLNVRQFPSTTAKIIKTLAKGEIIDGRPSAASSGWIEVLDTSGYAPLVVGYASAQFLTKQ